MEKRKGWQHEHQNFGRSYIHTCNNCAEQYQQPMTDTHPEMSCPSCGGGFKTRTDFQQALWESKRR